MFELKKKYEAIVVGVSSGGLFALQVILEKLPADFPIPIIAVQHRSPNTKVLLEELLQNKCKIKIKQADEKEKIQKGTVYFGPPDYHLLIEKNCTFSLSSAPHEHFSRPSINVLFETAAAAYKNRLIGIILTGTNNDGAAGIKMIHEQRGITIAQNPKTAQYPFMPQSAINTGGVQFIFGLDEIKEFLINAGKQ